MARSVTEYLKLLQSLLPKGKLWNRESTSILTQVLTALGDEFVRVDIRSDGMITEAFVSTTTELISEHETDYGIPEPGKELESTLDARIGVLNAKLLQVGQQNKEYFIDVVAKINYTITITEYIPAWCGIAAVGDPCGDLDVLFYWKINVDINGTGHEFSIDFAPLEYGSLYKDSIDYVLSLQRSLDQVIFEINKIKPGHTIALYDYYNAEFARAFSWGYKGFPYHDGSIPIEQYNSGFSNAFTSVGNYDGTYLIGAFDAAFDLAHDAHFGGEFDYAGFGDGFHHPA